MTGKKKLIVIGGGAAGMFCAINAARLDPSLSVTVLEKTHKLLSKVKVSGGGRCNVTHACNDILEMAKRYPRGTHFVRKAFYSWFTTDTIQWFADRSVELKTEADGRMFPVTDSSQTIIDCLMKEANKADVEILMRTEVAAVEVRKQDGDGKAFVVRLSDSRVLETDLVCIACGGYPKSGMFEWIRQLSHSIEPPVPSLFTFNIPVPAPAGAASPGANHSSHSITQLMGISVPDARVRIIGSKLQERGPLLITHWGFSGPSVLRLSAWGARELASMDYKFSILVNWLPEYNEQTLKEEILRQRQERAPQKISGRNPFGLPQRLWEHWLAVADVDEDLRWGSLPAKEQNFLVRQICAGEFAVQGKTIFKEEFVTAGGVKLSEVDPSTMQSRIVQGLYFAGEILDVDGITGGFNFQHAWTSGWIAAKSISEAGG